MKLLAALLLFTSEAIGIYSELKIASLVGKSARFLDFLPSLILVTLGGFGLVFGYYWLYRISASIWVPTIVSLGSIFVVEPILIYYMFNEGMSPKIIVSIVLVTLGIIVALK